MSLTTPLRVAEDTDADATIRHLVAAEVRSWMGRRSVSQMQLAEALDLSQTAVSRRLRGITPFDVVDLAKTAGLLNVSITTLLGEAGTTPHRPGGPGVAAEGKCIQPTPLTSGFRRASWQVRVVQPTTLPAAA